MFGQLRHFFEMTERVGESAVAVSPDSPGLGSTMVRRIRTGRRCRFRFAPGATGGCPRTQWAPGR